MGGRATHSSTPERFDPVSKWNKAGAMQPPPPILKRSVARGVQIGRC